MLDWGSAPLVGYEAQGNSVAEAVGDRLIRKPAVTKKAKSEVSGEMKGREQ